MSVVLYILEFLFCSALFVALYKLLIEGRVSFRWARIYFVWSMVVAADIPVLELPLYPADTLYFQIPIYESLAMGSDVVVEEPAYSPMAETVIADKQIDWSKVLTIAFWAVYAVVALMNLAVMVWRLWQIKRLRDGLCACS